MTPKLATAPNQAGNTPSQFTLLRCWSVGVKPSGHAAGRLRQLPLHLLADRPLAVIVPGSRWRSRH